MAKQIDTKVITNEVRLSYVHLLEPYAQDNKKDKEPMFSCMLLIPKSDKETLECLKNAQKAAYDNDKSKLKGQAFEKVKMTLHDAEEKFDVEDRPECKGMMCMSVRCKEKPGIINKYKEEVTSSDEVYSGVYARVSVNAYAYNTDGNRGITFGLNNVQITRKGEYLGGRASADEDFDIWDADDDDDALDMLG